ncbi:MAG: hypothetical protein EP347_05865 [Alphaproteobacteria bacterium]|nr:MAG: hypothetical protein EP347_05865 [Alphaproteobacteria bacterium]
MTTSNIQIEMTDRKNGFRSFIEKLKVLAENLDLQTDDIIFAELNRNRQKIASMESRIKELEERISKS